MPRNVTPKQLRQLRQFQEMSEEEFDNYYSEHFIFGRQVDTALEQRISDLWEEFEKEYDLSDLKVNDRENLRALILAIISLNDIEHQLARLRAGGLTTSNTTLYRELSGIASQLRADIVRLQAELKIGRKSRSLDKEASLLEYINNLKQRARQFAQKKMKFIFCPSCNMLLATVWVLYPNAKNRLVLTCERCKNKVTIDLSAIQISNKVEVLPESME